MLTLVLCLKLHSTYNNWYLMRNHHYTHSNWLLQSNLSTLCVFRFDCLGGYRERETPGSIPNPEAKPLLADNTYPFRIGNVSRCLVNQFLIIHLFIYLSTFNHSYLIIYFTYNLIFNLLLYSFLYAFTVFLGFCFILLSKIDLYILIWSILGGLLLLWSNSN